MASLSSDKELCSTCSLKISRNKKSIKCLTCGGRFHTRASCIKLPVTCHQTEIDICNMCLSCSLPFYSIDDLEFHFIFGNFNRLPCDEVMDRLTQLKFNPLDFDNNITNIKNTRCTTRIHNKVSETFSDRKFYLKHKLSTASLQSSTGKVIINYSTDIATGQWFTITTIMICNITMISFAYVNSQCNEYTCEYKLCL